MDDLKLYGVPGGGKTASGLEWIVDRVREGSELNRVAFVSFTTAACEEARGRLSERFDTDPAEIPLCRTIHSLAKRALMIEGRDWLATDKIRKFGEEYGYDLKPAKGRANDDDPDERKRELGEDAALLSVWEFGRNRLVTDAGAAWDAFTDYDWQAASRLDYPRYTQLVEDYERWKRGNWLRDYTDLLLDLVECPVYLKCSVAVLDEAQDFTPLLWRAADILFRDADFRAALGDDDQCQPPGSMVLTTAGYKEIELLDPAVDRLPSYSRTGSYVTGLEAGYPFQIARRPYAGQMFAVSAGGRCTQATGNHRWLVRWTAQAQAAETCVVYLMRQGDRFRVGWCQLFRNDRCFHLGARARLENADAAWILKVTNDRTEASLWESVVAARYGLPTITFRTVASAQHYTKKTIDRVFAELGDLTEKALICLRDHGRRLELPIWTPQKAYERRGGTSIAEVESCNLVSGMMAVPAYIEHGKVRWEPIRVSASAYTGPVYSLSVEPHQTYIADGLVTHNCLYSFGGAEPSLMNDRPARAVVKLVHSHRLPSVIVKVARAIIEQNSDRTEKEMLPLREGGSASFIPSLNECDLLNGQSWAVLVRNWRIYDLMTTDLEHLGVPYRATGARYTPWSELGPLQAVRTIWQLSAGERIAMGDLKPLLQKTRAARGAQEGAWKWGVKEKLAEHCTEHATDRIDWQALPGLGMTEWGFDRVMTRDLTVLSRDISERDLTAYANGAKRGTLFEPVRLRLGTVHSFKGREADNVVVVMGCTGAPFRAMNDPDRREEEIRVAYVAATRARERLYGMACPPSAGLYPWELVGL